MGGCKYTTGLGACQHTADMGGGHPVSIFPKDGGRFPITERQKIFAS